MAAERRPALLCFDGSAGSRRAIEVAGEVLGGGSALVLSAWEPLDSAVAPVPGLAGMLVGGVEKINEESAGVAEELARQGVEAAAGAGFDAEALPMRAKGRVWRTIIDVADQRDVRVIVLGSRGLEGVSALLGSVAYRVVHHSDRPVFLVPAAPEEDAGD